MFQTDHEKQADEALDAAKLNLIQSIESLSEVVVKYQDVYNSNARVKHRNALYKLLEAREVMP